MKVFISGAITYEPNYKAIFDEAERRLTEQGHDAMNPAWTSPARLERFSHDDYLHISLAMLDVCDAIYMLDGWTRSKGAKIEFCYAKENGKRIIWWDETLPKCSEYTALEKGEK